MEIINGMINAFYAMEMIPKLIIVIAFTIIALGILYVAICFIWFVLQELNHEIRKAKRTVKKILFDLEWNLKH